MTATPDPTDPTDPTDPNESTEPTEPAEPTDPADPNAVAPDRTESDRTEPDRTEPDRPESDRTEPDRTEPDPAAAPVSAPGDPGIDPSQTEDRDLGFGSVVASSSRRRLLNRDGSFNVERHGLGWRTTLSLYHSLLEMSWPRFTALALAAYLIVNAIFACAYVAAGPGALEGMPAGSAGERFLQGFFFSVHTLSTVGYGHIVPASLAANLLMTVEAIAGLFGLALGTGLIFARFSRPRANIVFSRAAIIAPYRGGTAFEFRLANRRRNQLIDVEARVLFSRREPAANGRLKRNFYQLDLERRRVTFFPLAWTIVHPIDETSPLWRVTPEELVASDPEFLVLLTGIDETFSQIVHARTSYKADEVVWQARFTNIFKRSDPNAPLAVDVSRIHEIKPAA